MTVRTANTIDVEDPPEGYRLCISRTASELGISVRELAAAAGLSATAIFRVTSENSWPVKRDPAEIRAALEALCVERGATPEQMSTLWHAYVRNRARVLANERRPDPIRSIPHHPSTEKDEVSEMLIEMQTPTPEARRHFKLLKNPFEDDLPDPTQLFKSDDTAYVHEACMQAATNGRFIAVIGESGAGKTTIMADLEERMRRDQRAVVVIRPWVLGMENATNSREVRLKSTDVLAAIVRTLDRTVKMPGTETARSDLACELLTKSAEAGYSHVLVIEEAHSLPDNTLKHLKRLHEMRSGGRRLMGIILVAQPELRKRLTEGLRNRTLREVAQRIEIVLMLPLDKNLTAYLEHRAKLAGRRLEEFIDRTGVEAIETRLTVKKTGARGELSVVSLLYPLVVNNLATAALNKAAELGVPAVTRDVVRVLAL